MRQLTLEFSNKEELNCGNIKPITTKQEGSFLSGRSTSFADVFRSK